MIVKLHDKEIDLSKAVPLKVGDWRALKKLGVNPKDLEVFDWEIGGKFLHYVLHKADSSVTEEDVNNLLPTDLLITAVFRAAGGEQTKNPS